MMVLYEQAAAKRNIEIVRVLLGFDAHLNEETDENAEIQKHIKGSDDTLRQIVDLIDKCRLRKKVRLMEEAA